MGRFLPRVPIIRAAVPAERIFYDGDCGLCHRFVRFVVSRDPEGRAFRYAPLGGETFRAEVPEHRREGLPDSVVLLTDDGRLLSRSQAVSRVLMKLGRAWKAVAMVIRIVPRPVADAAYDTVARVRKRLFRRPEKACPLLPPNLRSLFDP